MDVKTISIKCAGCGETLNPNEAVNGVVCCPYCGRSTTIPKYVTPERITAYCSAMDYIERDDFENAEKILHELLADFSDDPELYWSLVRCTYGIKMEKDYSTGAVHPTLLIMQDTSILVDSNYSKALQYASDEAKGIYESIAKEVEKIQKKYQEIIGREKPFDIL